MGGEGRDDSFCYTLTKAKYISVQIAYKYSFKFAVSCRFDSCPKLVFALKSSSRNSTIFRSDAVEKKQHNSKKMCI